MRLDRQGMIKLNTGDTLTRVNGTETLVTPGGDALVLNSRNSTVQLLAPGARIEIMTASGQFKPVAQLPGDFG